MKVITILFVIVAGAISKETYKLPQAVVDKVYKFAKPCADEHKIDYSMIPKVADGTLPRDDASNKFLYCFALSAGYITEDGKIIVDKLSAVVKDHPYEAEFKEALKKCNENPKEDPIATVVAMNACFAEAPPVRVVL